MTSADVIRAHSYGVQIEADVRKPRPVAIVANANFDRMREQMQAANRSLAVDVDYQTQCAASLAVTVRQQRAKITRLWTAVAVLAVVVIGLAATLWGMAR